MPTPSRRSTDPGMNISFKSLPQIGAGVSLVVLLVAGIVKVSQLVSAVEASSVQIAELKTSIGTLTGTVQAQGSKDADLDVRVNRIEAQQVERETIHKDLSDRIAANDKAIEDLYARIGAKPRASSP